MGPGGGCSSSITGQCVDNATCEGATCQCNSDYYADSGQCHQRKYGPDSIDALYLNRDCDRIRGPQSLFRNFCFYVLDIPLSVTYKTVNNVHDCVMFECYTLCALGSTDGSLSQYVCVCVCVCAVSYTHLTLPTMAVV